MAALATRQGAANRPHPDNARADARTAIRDFAMRNISANPYDSVVNDGNEVEFVSKCIVVRRVKIHCDLGMTCEQEGLKLSCQK
jgi:hypothetical protein